MYLLYFKYAMLDFVRHKNERNNTCFHDIHSRAKETPSTGN